MFHCRPHKPDPASHHLARSLHAELRAILARPINLLFFISVCKLISATNDAVAKNGWIPFLNPLQIGWKTARVALK